ncbi:MAG TPA: DUF4038 domain-containing protein [Draconibacterium sp.]|nr:DUF4038 domain-containing protein [Draconibacterium sp.]
MMRSIVKAIIVIIIFSFNYLVLYSIEPVKSAGSERGEIGIYKNKFIWTQTNQAFVPNLIMLDALTSNAITGESTHNADLNFSFQTGNKNDLSVVTEENLALFIDEFMLRHGFNGVHVPVFGQWFHIGDNKVTKNDSVPDPRTFEKLAMIINKVYEAGGVTYLWVWGDHQRQWTSKSSKDGIMGLQEKKVMDMIAEKLGPLNGWFMGYGFDLFEWVSEKDLKNWHDYMNSKPGWNKLMGARSATNQFTQFYEGLDFYDYEFHKPWYETLVKMINTRPQKPSLSGDRYRIRRHPPSKWPEKDYNEEETRRGLWHHTMAGGIGAIWGNLDSSGVYSNREELKCFSVFWNDNNRFKKDMIPDNALTNGYCLREHDNHYVFYMEDTDEVTYSFSGKPKHVFAVDTRKRYSEIKIGKLKTGQHSFKAPYKSDWALAAMEK